MDGDVRQLLARQRDTDQAMERLSESPVVQQPTLLCVTTVVTTYPSLAGAFYALTPQTLLGTESEGSPGVLSSGGAPIYALNLGGAIPVVGQQVLATYVGNRWVFQYG